MTTQIYATQVTAYYLAALAAVQAGASPLNIAGGTLVVGDGNGAVPTISALIAANGVTHEVWRGQTITSVVVDPSNSDQLDIGCDIPAAIGGAEIGPFNVTEFAILDVTGACCVVGVTNLQKTVSSQGQTSDLAWTAAVAAGVGEVTLTPPSASYATMSQVIVGYDANLPDCTAPITKTDTLESSGWLHRVFGIAAAAQPADVVTPTTSAAAMGSGRPASAAEYAAGAPTAGGFAWPWPTLQQVAASFAAIMAAIAALGASLAGYLLKSGGTMTGALVLAADPTAAPQAATKRYVDNAISGISIPSIAGLLPEAGGTMTGPLITARDPQTAMEAANKEYVDAAAINPFATTGVGAVVIGQVSAGGSSSSTSISLALARTHTLSFATGADSWTQGPMGVSASASDERFLSGFPGTWVIQAWPGLGVPNTGAWNSAAAVFLRTA